MSKNRYIFFILSLGLLFSCQKGPTIEGEYVGDLPITFSPAIHVSQTKASTDTAFLDTTFYANAWTVGKVAGGKRYMNAAPVTKSGDVWKPTTEYYWPKTDSLVFVATYGNLWEQISDSCDTLKTGGMKKFSPTMFSSTDGSYSPLLYSDKTDTCTWKSGCVAILFHNALAAVTASINVKRFDDAAKIDGTKLYYNTYSGKDTTGKQACYVITFGLNPNAGTSKVYLHKDSVITHIWRAEIVRVKTRNVANQGSLSMAMGNDGKWILPENKIWTTPDSLKYYNDAVSLFDTSSTVHQVPIPSNLVGFNCNFGDEYYVMPQNLFWSTLTGSNNQMSDVIFDVEDYMADNNGDGVFDYRDVYKYYVVTNTDASGAVIDSLLVDKPSTAKKYKSYEFYKWYEWDGGDKTSILKQLHDKAGYIWYCEKQDSLPTPYLKYFVKKTISLYSLHKLSDIDTYWKMNTKTTYNIALDPLTSQISFSPTVKAWSSDAPNINVE